MEVSLLEHLLQNKRTVWIVAAVAVVSGGDWFVYFFVSLCYFSLRNKCRRDRTRRVWTQSAQSTPGDARAHGHAACARNFPDWLMDLAKNSEGRTVEVSGSILHLRIAHR